MEPSVGPFVRSFAERILWYDRRNILKTRCGLVVEKHAEARRIVLCLLLDFRVYFFFGANGTGTEAQKICHASGELGGDVQDVGRGLGVLQWERKAMLH